MDMNFRNKRLSILFYRNVRKLIDGAAFHIYGHWVKKNDGQNRAAMFEHSPKKDTGLNPDSEEMERKGIERAVFILSSDP